MCSEAAEMVEIFRETGSVAGYFGSLYNYVDVISIILMITCMIIW